MMEKHWRLLERGWRKRIIGCMDRLHKIHLIERKAISWEHMVRERDLQENKQPLVLTMYGQICGSLCPMQRKESKTKMGYQETKAGPRQTIESNILHWTKRRRIPAHNESRSEKVGSSDASSNALQNTDKEQWWNPPQYWETQDRIRLCCWCGRKHETKARRAGHKPHQYHLTAKGMNSMTHYSLVRKFIPMPQALKIPDAKGAVEKELEKLKKISAWQLTKVRNKKEVIEGARNKGRKVHLAS